MLVMNNLEALQMLSFLVMIFCALFILCVWFYRERKKLNRELALLEQERVANAKKFEEKSLALDKLHKREKLLLKEIKSIVENKTPTNWDEKIQEAEQLDKDWDSFQKGLKYVSKYRGSYKNADFVRVICGRAPLDIILRPRRTRVVIPQMRPKSRRPKMEV